MNAHSTSSDRIRISMVIPTYNNRKIIGECLTSIFKQEIAPDEFEVIVADGGSSDDTRKIAATLGARIVHNPLRSGEAGKAAGLRESIGELVAFVDSDNILPTKNWLNQMIKPFEHENILGAEPIEFTYRRQDPIIARYIALIGACDPLQLYVGNRDRWSWMKGNWTENNHLLCEDRGSYYLVTLPRNSPIPTIGANGFVGRRSLLKDFNSEYYFDVDVVYDLVQTGMNKVAMVKTGIVHLHANSSGDFVRKAYRRIRDYYMFRKVRKYPWLTTRRGILKFCLSAIILLPTVRESLLGYRKKPDRAWLFHPLASILVLLTYGLAFLRVRRLKEPF